MSRPRLVLMAKEPQPRAVKTRLATALGFEGAAQLYRAFLEDLCERVITLDGVEHVLATWPPSVDAAWLDPYRARFLCVAQRGAGLGERMRASVDDGLAAGATSVLVLGTDLPTLPLENVTDALARLAAGADVVIGPDPDGGYYALGLTRPVPEIFDVPLSTAHVLDATLARVRALGLRVELLPSWADVDVPADLVRLRRELADPRIAARAPRTAQILARFAEHGT